MCLILVAWHSHPDFPCIIAANRDEFHGRPTQPAHWWRDRPDVLGGRDGLAGGSWLGITRSGRFAALTNYRSARPKRADTPSRGTIVSDVLASGESTANLLDAISRTAPRFDGFNVLFSDGDSLGIYESESRSGRILPAGIYGLSNHLLDTDWPKVRRAKARLPRALADLPECEPILALLRDDQPAADAELPRTGVSLEWERLLSSAFVRGPDYGTRCSTIILVDRSGSKRFEEWSWDSRGVQSGRVSVRFTT